jgi:hypothetical protein
MEEPVRMFTRVIGTATILLTTSALSAPAAHATTDTIDGGCFIAAVDLGSVNNFATAGFLGDVSVTRDDSPGPAQATVTCWLEINGVEERNTRFDSSGLGQQFGLEEISFVFTEGDSVFACEHVTYADGTEKQTCFPAPTQANVPPHEVLDSVRAFAQTVDPTLCPLLAGHAGAYPGGLGITPSGDVWVDDPFDLSPKPLYDCPPYGPALEPVLVIAGPVRT